MSNGNENKTYLELYCVDESSGDPANGDPGSFHVLREECRHENTGSRGHSKAEGQARHHQGGHGQHGEGRVEEAQAHHHHGQGGHQEEHGGDVLAVVPGLQQWTQKKAHSDGRLKNRLRKD